MPSCRKSPLFEPKMPLPYVSSARCAAAATQGVLLTCETKGSQYPTRHIQVWVLRLSHVARGP